MTTNNVFVSKRATLSHSKIKKELSSMQFLSIPTFWRMVGLLVADGDSPTIFCNTNPKLIELFAKLGNLIEKSSTQVKLKREKRLNRKRLWRVYTFGKLREALLKAYKNITEYIPLLPEKSFWQFITGIYEGDGSITLRPGREYKNNKKFYPVMEIKFGRKEETIVDKILERINKNHIKVSITFKKNYIRFRITSIYSVVRFFKKISPVIKNPLIVESFDTTKAKNPEKVVKVFKEIKILVEHLHIPSEEKFVDLRKFNRVPKH
jgi:hypothetical protein